MLYGRRGGLPRVLESLEDETRRGALAHEREAQPRLGNGRVVATEIEQDLGRTAVDLAQVAGDEPSEDAGEVRPQLVTKARQSLGVGAVVLVRPASSGQGLGWGLGTPGWGSFVGRLWKYAMITANTERWLLSSTPSPQGMEDVGLYSGDVLKTASAISHAVVFSIKFSNWGGGPPSMAASVFLVI